MSSILDVLQIGNDSKNSTFLYETSLEETENAVDAAKKAIRYYTPPTPVIGIQPGTVLNGLNESAEEFIEPIEESEDDATQQLDDSSGNMDDADMIGDLDESGETLDGSTEFV
jgi:hypothetical protein